VSQVLPPPPPDGARINAPNKREWAIPSTLFCCRPRGVVSMVYAAQVDGQHAAVRCHGPRSRC